MVLKARSHHLFYEEVFKESNVLSSLHHKNIVSFKEVKINQVLDSEEYVLMVMEYLEGGSLLDELKKKLKKNERFLEEEISTILRQILEALAFIHSINLIHGDLKLENVLYAKPNQINSIKIIDFGLGQQLRRSFISFAEGSGGTPLYMSPEHLFSHKYTYVILNS